MDIFMNGSITPNYQSNCCVLFNADMREVIKNIKDKTIDLIVTDPPYKISTSGGGIEKEGKKYCGGMLKHNSQYVKEGKLFKFNEIKFNEWMPELYRVLKERRALLLND